MWMRTCFLMSPVQGAVETQAAPNQETTARAGSVQRPMYVNSEGINARNKSLAQELMIQETGVNVT